MADDDHPLTCAECGGVSPPKAEGWTAWLDDDDNAQTFYPECAEREFGSGS
jgi:hypothetical protein